MKRKTISFILSLVMLLSISVVPAYAEESSYIKNEASLFLDEFLCNLKDGNIQKAYNTMNDERLQLKDTIELSQLTEAEKAYIEYVESGNRLKDLYSKDAISEYEILGPISKDIISARIKFENGAEAIVPFCVQKDGDSYVINITEKDIESYGYKEIRASSSSAPLESKPLATSVGILKDEYEFSYLYGTIYGIDSFSVSRNAITIDGYQANDALESGWESKAEVIYAVVVEHWYGDYVWATTTNAIVKNGSFSVTIVGKDSSHSDLRIRISNQTGAYPRSKGDGKLYSVTV